MAYNGIFVFLDPTDARLLPAWKCVRHPLPVSRTVIHILTRYVSRVRAYTRMEGKPAIDGPEG